jgi:hypothetical protein
LSAISSSRPPPPRLSGIGISDTVSGDRDRPARRSADRDPAAPPLADRNGDAEARRHGGRSRRPWSDAAYETEPRPTHVFAGPAPGSKRAATV